MARYYRRRSGSPNITLGALTVIGFTIYAYAKAYSYLLPYMAVFCGLVIILVVLLKMRKRRMRLRDKAYVTFVTQSDEQDIDTMSPLEFEKYVAARLAEKGYTNIQLTEYYDWGVDIIAHKNNVVWGVQVKHCSNLVKVAAVRQVVTALKKYDCDRAMVVTNGRYSRQAIELAKSNNCLLVKV